MPWYVLKRRRVFIDFKNQEVKRLRGVICTRYSYNKQREESIEGQIRECKEFARTSRIDIINTYIDRAMSTTNDNRPQFQRMNSDSCLDRFDVVLIWKSDRFSKNWKQAIPYRDILRENGVKLLSATEPNIEGPAGILFESMNDGYNKYYVFEMKTLIDLLANTIYLNVYETIDIIFNYRLKEPQVPLSLLS